jgi:hypothetical protein
MATTGAWSWTSILVRVSAFPALPGIGPVVARGIDPVVARGIDPVVAEDECVDLKKAELVAYMDASAQVLGEFGGMRQPAVD